MRFPEWVEKHGPEALSKLTRDCSDLMSRETVRRTRLGRPLRNYEKAKRISEATGGLVSIEEIVQGLPGWERRLKVKPRRNSRKKRH